MRNRQLEGEEEGWPANVVKISPLICPENEVLEYEKSGLKIRRASRNTGGRSEMGPGALNTAALFADLRRNRKMKMKRQEENKQQDRRAQKAANIFRFLHAGTEHGSEPSQSVPACQENAQQLWPPDCIALSFYLPSL